MSNEMQQCVNAFNWKFEDLQLVTINAMESSFISYEEKIDLIEKVIKPTYTKISAE
jgi:adenosine deaminase